MSDLIETTHRAAMNTIERQATAILRQQAKIERLEAALWLIANGTSMMTIDWCRNVALNAVDPLEETTGAIAGASEPGQSDPTRISNEASPAPVGQFCPHCGYRHPPDGMCV